MALAPDLMVQLAHDWERAVLSAVFSGIVGDSSHGYGYHRAADELPSSDYSRQLPGDRNGVDGRLADAIDMSHDPSDMKLITRRLYNSWKDRNDPRLNYWREGIGTLDGVNVIYMDYQSGHQGTANKSHLWHIHNGGLRCYAKDPNAMAALLSIVKGETWPAYYQRTNDPIGRGQLKPTPPPPPKPSSLDEDGKLGPATIRKWQQRMGTPQDGVISTPSDLVSAVQRYLNQKIGAGLTVDGVGIKQDGRSVFNTTKALQRHLGTTQDGVLSLPASDAVKALQHRLNNNTF